MKHTPKSLRTLAGASLMAFTVFSSARAEDAVPLTESQKKMADNLAHAIGELFKSPPPPTPPANPEVAPRHFITFVPIGEDGTKKIPANVHPSYPHLIPASGFDTWCPEPGYNWTEPFPSNDGKVRWVPGAGHPSDKNCIASTTEGSWQPSSGYEWSDPKQPSIPVVEIGLKDKRRRQVETQILDLERAIELGEEATQKKADSITRIKTEIAKSEAIINDASKSSLNKTVTFLALAEERNQLSEKKDELSLIKSSLNFSKDKLLKLRKELISLRE